MGGKPLRNNGVSRSGGGLKEKCGTLEFVVEGQKGRIGRCGGGIYKALMGTAQTLINGLIKAMQGEECHPVRYCQEN